MNTAAARTTKERLYLFDTTLRDGAQTNGVDFTLHDKRIIAGILDELGIDYVEGGYPGANPTDTEFFATKPKLDHAKFTAFGMVPPLVSHSTTQRAPESYAAFAQASANSESSL